MPFEIRGAPDPGVFTDEEGGFQVLAKLIKRHRKKVSMGPRYVYLVPAGHSSKEPRLSHRGQTESEEQQSEPKPMTEERPMEGIERLC